MLPLHRATTPRSQTKKTLGADVLLARAGRQRHRQRRPLVRNLDLPHLTRPPGLAPRRAPSPVNNFGLVVEGTPSTPEGLTISNVGQGTLTGTFSLSPSGSFSFSGGGVGLEAFTLTSGEQRQIESRQQITDHAILDAVLSHLPHKVLDVGCGEGWLARKLAASNIHVVGIVIVPGPLEEARRAGGGDFRVVSYEELAIGKLSVSADVVVSNFALSGSAFTDPAPWYFRTLERWMKLFVDNAFRLLEMREPIHPKTQEPASVIFIAKSAR